MVEGFYGYPLEGTVTVFRAVWHSKSTLGLYAFEAEHSRVGGVSGSEMESAGHSLSCTTPPYTVLSRLSKIFLSSKAYTLPMWPGEAAADPKLHMVILPHLLRLSKICAAATT